jgi:Flp pilus assembly protein TadG
MITDGNPVRWEKSEYRRRRRRSDSFRHRTAPRGRRGLAATEFAVFLPLLVLLALVPLDLSAMIFLKQSLHVAAYETVREAAKKNSTYAEAVPRGQQILNERGINGGTIEISPDEATLAPGTLVTVTVTADYSSNAVLGFAFATSVLESRLTMLKE